MKYLRKKNKYYVNSKKINQWVTKVIPIPTIEEALLSNEYAKEAYNDQKRLTEIIKDATFSHLIDINTFKQLIDLAKKTI